MCTTHLHGEMSWSNSLIQHLTSFPIVRNYVDVHLFQLDIVVMLEPFAIHMTKSEFHTIVVASHASIAGFAYAIFIWFGVNNTLQRIHFPMVSSLSTTS